MESKHKYKCSICNIVDNRILVKKRIEQDAVVFARGQGQEKKYVIYHMLVCKHCGNINKVEFISDCKLGSCKDGCLYGGGLDSFGLPPIKCPICKNKFSYGTSYRHEDFDDVELSDEMIRN